MIDGINPMLPIAHVHVRDRDYNCYISVCTTTHNIHVFKYNSSRCEYEVFDSQEEAQRYLNRMIR